MGRSKRKAGSDDIDAQSNTTEQKYAAHYPAAWTTDLEFTSGRGQEEGILWSVPDRFQCGGVVVPDSTSPGFVRIWDRDGSGPRFVPSQDSPLLLT